MGKPVNRRRTTELLLISEFISSFADSRYFESRLPVIESTPLVTSSALLGQTGGFWLTRCSPGKHLTCRPSLTRFLYSVVLLAAEGKTDLEIAASLNISNQKAVGWRKRFLQLDLALSKGSPVTEILSAVLLKPESR